MKQLRCEDLTRASDTYLEIPHVPKNAIGIHSVFLSGTLFLLLKLVCFFFTTAALRNAAHVDHINSVARQLVNYEHLVVGECDLGLSWNLTDDSSEDGTLGPGDGRSLGLDIIRIPGGSSFGNH